MMRVSKLSKAALSSLVALGTLCLAAPAQSADPAPWPDYKLSTTIDPATHRLSSVAEVTLPAKLAGQPVEFVLAANFKITASNPAVEKLPAEATPQAFAGINGTSEELANRRGVSAYRLKLAPGSTTFRIEYSGLVDIPPTASPEEYARSFAETPGIVSTQGVYLAGSTLWYPQLAGAQAAELVTYSLTVNTPAGWHLIAPGNGVSTGADGMARWTSPSAVDEISLAGGPLTPYTANAGMVEAQVYLREPDPALASKYLDATSRYLRMYNELLGAYPYRKFALVENFWETGYGMPSYTLLGPQIIRFPFILTSSYPHEILHNWWGNSVYVDYATGNWCEGLTAYLADHLMKEIEGQGAEYRRDVLKKYRDFASSSADFPLRDFRSRHSAATEAVGYGKTLMGFHMLRQQMGDDAFRQALSSFYKDYRGQRASFSDVRSVFEKVSGRDLGRFFDEWTNRTGAADLRVADVKVTEKNKRYTVSGVIRQQQSGAYDIEVPVVVATAAGPVIAKIHSREAATPFSIETTAAPQSVAVDPAFDVFRILDPRETAPSIGQIFGASEVLAVLPSEPAAETETWRSALSAWQSPSNKITIVTDREITKLPADRSVWLLGRQNRFAATHFGSDPALGLSVSRGDIGIGSSKLPFAGHSHVLTHRHPDDPKLAVGWVTAGSPAALTGLMRKLPHYGKYSWLAFAGDEPANVAKGEWPTTDSPLLVNLQGKGLPAALTLPRRAPLAEPPAAWSAEQLTRHVNFLAAPEREGRGFGSAGLDAAAEYIKEQFAAAKLQPGGDDGSFFQTFTAKGGVDNSEHKLRNVIAVLPGSKPEFKGEVALLTAHYDHLGFGWPGARADAVGKLHPGADDNASGVAVLIEIAKQLAARPAPPRTIVFIAFSGEEAGLLGSRHYVSHPVPVPVSGMYGVINMDTVGRLGDQPVSVIATESAREWPFVFRGITAVTGVQTRNIPGAAESSDQKAFIDAGVPGIQIFSGAGLDYHRPTDTPDKVDGAGMVRVATVAAEAIDYLASTEKRLSVSGSSSSSTAAPPAGSGTRRVSVGAIPDFAFQGPGLRIEGVVPDSPADQAGMQAGDILTHLNGSAVNGLGGFNELLKTLQPGDKVELRWMRAGAEQKASVTVVAR